MNSGPSPIILSNQDRRVEVHGLMLTETFRSKRLVDYNNAFDTLMETTLSRRDERLSILKFTASTGKTAVFHLSVS